MSLRLVPTATPQTSSTARAHALLGARPTLSFVADDAQPDVCCTFSLVRQGARYLGVVSDKSLFADRVRMGMAPRFFLGDQHVVAAAGHAACRVLGAVDAVSVDVRAAVAGLVGPYDVADAVVVEVVPDALAVVVDEDAAGAVPRT